MYTVTVILHLIVCFLMIAAILLQAGKGAEIGAAFGGSSQTVFGSRGPGTFLSKSHGGRGHHFHADLAHPGVTFQAGARRVFGD